MKPPILDLDTLQDALKAIADATPLPNSHPLLTFRLVQDKLNHPDAILTSHTALIAVQMVIEESLLTYLGEERRGRTDVSVIQVDFQQNNPFREAYSVLYYHYLRPDLGISLDKMAAMVSTHTRTLQRRRMDGLGFLMQDLVNREMHLRRRERRLSLESVIPFAANLPLYGRDSLVNHIISLLKNQAVLLSGLPGSGKTFIAASIAHGLLSDVDDLYWINLLPDREYTDQILSEISATLPEFQGQSARRYLETQRILLIVEGLTPEHLQAPDLLWLQRPYTLFTSRQAWPNWAGNLFELGNFSPDDAYQFLLDQHPLTSEETLNRLATQPERLPGVLLDTINLMDVIPGAHPLTSSRIEDYFRQIWQRCSPVQRQLWLVAAYMQKGGLGTTEMYSFAGNRRAEIWELVSHHVFMWKPGMLVYHLSYGAHHFIQMNDVNETAVFAVLPESMGNLDFFEQFAVLWLQALANGLWEKLSPDSLYNSLKILSPLVSQWELWPYWDVAIQNIRPTIEDDYLWLLLEQARIKRWRGLLADSLSDLYEIVRVAGRGGQFMLYAQALVEVSLINSYYENWPAALEAAQDAERVFARYNATSATYQAILAQIRAYLNLDPRLALRLVQSVSHLPAALLLSCEALQILQDYPAAIKVGLKALEQISGQPSNRARALSTVALAYLGNHQYEQALAYLQQVMNILNYTADLMGRARVMNNMGVIYFETHNFEQANAMWHSAENEFIALQDAVGLNAVAYNLSLSPDQGRPRAL